MLHVRVQHHPRRAYLLDRLLSRLGALSVDVVSDPEPDGKMNPWRTYRACVDTPWPGDQLLVIQDDALPCDGFEEHALAAVDEKPDDVLALFVPGVMAHAHVMTRALSRGETWALLNAQQFIPVVATVWPRQHAELLADHAEAGARRLRIRDLRSDDALAGIYCRNARVPVWATVPSLVEHPDDEPSMIGKQHKHGRNRTRVAAVVRHVTR